MSSSRKPLTPDQVKAAFRRNGRTFKDWAATNGYDIGLVYRVLNGAYKAQRGKAHEVAVALGLKVPDEQFTPDAIEREAA